MIKYVKGYIIDDSVLVLVEFQYIHGPSLTRKDDGWYMTPISIVKMIASNSEITTDGGINSSFGPYPDMDTAIMRRFSPQKSLVRLTPFQYYTILRLVEKVMTAREVIITPPVQYPYAPNSIRNPDEDLTYHEAYSDIQHQDNAPAVGSKRRKKK